MRDAASGAPRAPSFHDTARKRKTPAFEECRRLRDASGKSVDRVLQPLARLVLRLLGGRDLDLLPGTRVPALYVRARRYGDRPEPAHAKPYPFSHQPTPH